jgi:hypothetical protein
MRPPLEEDGGGDDRRRDQRDARARVTGDEGRDRQHGGGESDASGPRFGETRQQEGRQVHVGSVL